MWRLRKSGCCSSKARTCAGLPRSSLAAELLYILQQGPVHLEFFPVAVLCSLFGPYQRPRLVTLFTPGGAAHSMRIPVAFTAVSAMPSSLLRFYVGSAMPFWSCWL